jgi:hypothetical protein
MEEFSITALIDRRFSIVRVQSNVMPAEQRANETIQRTN